MVVSDQRAPIRDKRHCCYRPTDASAENGPMQQIVSRRQGFTLIELMIAVAVIGILAAIAYPSFKSQLLRSRRADAMAVLTAVTQAQERYRANRSTFTRSLTDLLGPDAGRATKYYDVIINPLSDDAAMATGYTATAEPKDTQTADTGCGSLSIEVRGASVNYLASGADAGRCWAR